MSNDLIWAVAFVAVTGVTIYLINSRVKEMVEARRSRNEDLQRVELLERDNAAKLEAATVEERAEHERARLLQETAEARAAAEVAEAPELIKARIAEEERVIAARAEGRTMAAKERGAREGETGVISALLDAYKHYINSGSHSIRETTFDDWLGTINIRDFQ